MAFIGGINTQEINITVEGLDELERQFELLGKPPKRILTKAAKAGMAGPLADARANASAYSKTGMMKKGIKSITETPNRRNKAVYRINWWGKYSDVYKKKIINAGVYGGKKNPAYYPQSVEWGFPNKHGKVAGKYFVRAAIEKNQASSLQKVIDTLLDEMENLF